MAQQKDDKSTTAANEVEPQDNQEVAPGDDFEFVSEIPSSGGGNKNSKYDWGAYPAPKDGLYANKFYEVKSAKPLYTSIKKYKEKLEADGKPVPEFTIRTEKDETTGDVKGCRVYREK